MSNFEHFGSFSVEEVISRRMQIIIYNDDPPDRMLFDLSRLNRIAIRN